MTGAGAFVAVVGPSGAGKDTLLAYARTALAADPRYVFVRRVATLLVTAPDAVIAARLAARGRETAEEAARRIARESTLGQDAAADRVVSNDGTPEEGGRKLVLCLERIRSEIATSVADGARATAIRASA